MSSEKFEQLWLFVPQSPKSNFSRLLPSVATFEQQIVINNNNNNNTNDYVLVALIEVSRLKASEGASQRSRCTVHAWPRSTAPQPVSISCESILKKERKPAVPGEKLLESGWNRPVTHPTYAPGRNRTWIIAVEMLTTAPPWYPKNWFKSQSWSQNVLFIEPCQN